MEFIYLSCRVLNLLYIGFWSGGSLKDGFRCFLCNKFYLLLELQMDIC